MKKILFISLLLVNSFSYSQIFGKDPEIKINNISAENVWQITEMALIENEFSVEKFNPGESILSSDWITWKAIMISNRAVLHFSYIDNTLTMRIANRSYKTDKGWDESIGKLSKKKYKIFVRAVADKIIEINNNPDLIRKAVKASKLIPAFSAINTIGDIEWKLLEAKQTEQIRPVLNFKVTNNGTKDISLSFLTGKFDKLSGIGTARLRLEWEKFLEDNPKQTILKSNESMDVIVKVGQGYYLETGIGHLMTVGLEYNNANKLTLKIYNIPIPYKYQEGD